MLILNSLLNITFIQLSTRHYWFSLASSSVCVRVVFCLAFLFVTLISFNNFFYFSVKNIDSCFNSFVSGIYFLILNLFFVVHFIFSSVRIENSKHLLLRVFFVFCDTLV